MPPCFLQSLADVQKNQILPNGSSVPGNLSSRGARTERGGQDPDPPGRWWEEEGMSSLVVEWVNHSLHLDPPLDKANLESQLSTGYVIGEILVLCRLMEPKVLNDQFSEESDEEDKIQNFELISNCLRNNQVKFDEQLFARIMTQQYGAAATLLVQIKDWLKAKKDLENRPDSRVNKALISLRPHHFQRQAVSKSGHVSDFLQHLIDSVDLDNYKEIDMAIHLKHFHDMIQKAEEEKEQIEQSEQQEQSIAKATRRSVMLTKAREQKTFMKEWVAKGRKDWKGNWKKHEANFRRLLQYELFLVEQRRRKKDSQTDQAREEAKGVSWFETNMLRLGLGDDGTSSGGGKGGDKVRPSKEDALLFLERIRQLSVEDGKKMRREVGDMMAELKGKAKQTEKARKEREVRRRKEKVELAEAQKASDIVGEATDRAGELTDKAQTSQKEWATQWDERAAKAVRDREKEERVKEVMDNQKRAQEAAVQSFFDSMADKVQDMEATRAATKAEYDLTSIEKQLAKHEDAELMCLELVANLADFAVHCSEEKVAAGHGGDPVPLTLSQWNALKQRLVNGEIFRSPPTDNEEAEAAGGDTISEEPNQQPSAVERRGSVSSVISSVSSLLSSNKRRRPAHIDVLTSAMAYACWHAWVNNDGDFWRPTTTLFSQDRLAAEESPEAKIMKVANELLQDPKPRINLERPPKVGLPSPLRVALLGSRPDLMDLAKPLAADNNLVLVTVEIAIGKAIALSKGEASDEDKAALTAATPLQALQQLGTQYLAVTTDPKKPAPASDQLILEIVLAYANAHVANKAGWLLVGYPSTVLQAKLLARGLTGVTDPEVEDYLQSLTGKPVKKKPAGRASDAGLKKAKVEATATSEPSVPPPRVCGLDTILRIRAPTEETNDELGAFYMSCAPGVLGHPVVTLGAGDDGLPSQMEETLDILIDCALDAKSQPPPTSTTTGAGAAAPSETGSSMTATELMEEVERRRTRRVDSLSKAAQMWRSHVVEGRYLDLDRLRKEVLERWENQSTVLGKETHRVLTRLVKQMGHAREERDVHRRRLAHILRGHLPGFQDISSLAYLSHGKLPPDVLVNELEVGLDDVVEERYDECCAMKEAAMTTMGKEAEKLMTEAAASLTALIRVEYKRGKASMSLLTAFDTLNNLSTQRLSTVPSKKFFPLTSTFRERLLQEVGSVPVPVSFSTEIRSAISSIEAGLHQAFTRPISVDAISDLDTTSAASLHRLRQILAALSHVNDMSKQLVDGIEDYYRTETVKRMKEQLEVVTDRVEKVRQLYQNGDVSGAKNFLHRLSNEGIEVDESRRAPMSVGPVVVDSGVCYLSPKHISTLIYSLRARASRYLFLKKESFIRSVSDCANKNAFPYSWTSVSRIRAVAAQLDPLKTGQIAWRRFIHALICGLVPRLPTMEELLTTRLAVDNKHRLSLTSSLERRPSFYQAMSPLRITANEFLDLPLWFEADLGPRAREVKELYALAWTEEDGKISLLSLLLQLCESLPKVADDDLLPPIPSALVKAVVLACQPLEKDMDPEAALRSYEVKIGASSNDNMPIPAIPHKALQQMLVSTYLHSAERASAWLEAQGFPRNKDILLSSLLMAPVWNSGPVIPFVICDVYGVLNGEEPPHVEGEEGKPESRGSGTSSGHAHSRPTGA